jgi:DNA (cytosine-5)-methyltransferase 1
MSDERPTFGSLFAGIGGIDLGLERAGFRCEWQVEIDDECRRVLAAQFPDVERFTDVCDVGADELVRVDLIVGGFPCQDVSVAGRRAGLAGQRSGLWHEFRRVVAEVAPRWVLIENVPGLLSSNDGRDMAVIVRGLVKLGYGVAWRVLDAQYFGVPQRRRRVFVVGHLGEPWSTPASILFEPQSCAGNPAPRRAPREGVAGTLGGGSGERGWAPDTDRMTFVPTLTAGAGTNRMSPGHGRDELMIPVSALTSRCGNTQDDQQTGQLLAFRPTDGLDMSVYDDLSPTLKVGSGRGIPSGPAIAQPVRTNQYNNSDPSMEASMRMHVHQGTAVRRLTPLECARLQGFPDDWLNGLELSDSAKYRMLGNAVCVPVAEWIGRRILEAMSTAA